MEIPSYCFSIRGQQLQLSRERCIFWEDQRILILSDTHFGKSGHFRKEGIGIPQEVYRTDLDRFRALITFYQPATIIVIGDLFHSHFNKEISWFEKIRNEFSSIKILLVTGNHDVLPAHLYRQLSIQTADKVLDIPPFSFVHDAKDMTEKDAYYFCGHLHPGIAINGKGRQKLILPCYHFTEKHACLPAFSKFTGISKIRLKKSEQAYMITDENIVPYADYSSVSSSSFSVNSPATEGS